MNDTISAEAAARRESARVNGRFGNQENSAPEATLAAPGFTPILINRMRPKDINVRLMLVGDTVRATAYPTTNHQTPLARSFAITAPEGTPVTEGEEHRLDEAPNWIREPALERLRDPKAAMVDRVFAAHLDGQTDGYVGVDEARALMLAVLDEDAKTPRVAVIDKDGQALTGTGVTVLDLGYLNDNWQGLRTAEEEMLAATEHLDTLRAAGMGTSRPAWQLRAHLTDQAASEYDLSWLNMAEQTIGGVYGQFIIVEHADTSACEVRRLDTGGRIVATYPDFDQARASVTYLEED